MKSKRRGLIAATVLTVALGVAQYGAGAAVAGAAVAGAGADGQVAPGPAAGACAALAGWKQGDVEIDTAQSAPEGSPASSGIPSTEHVMPAHCVVRGSIAKRTGADGKPYAITFELRLPDKWNGRFLYQGGGGYDGQLAPALGVSGSGKPALARGFAVVSTDAGHRDSGVIGNNADFGGDPQARADFAYNALDRVTQTAKLLIRGYYAAPIQRSYLAGCSGGGRQAMLATQRFPDHFDGVVAGAPAIRIASLGISGIKRAKAVMAMSPADYSRLLPVEDARIIADAYRQQCDAKDGLEDGLVFNRSRCNFRIKSLQCRPGRSENCLSADAIARFDGAAGPTRLRNGKIVYPAFTWDTAVSDPAWLFGRYGGAPGATQQQNVRTVQMAFFDVPRERLLDQITIDQAYAETQTMRAMAEVNSTDLDRFRQRGGKALYYMGMSDEVISTQDMDDYYARLMKRYGKATSSSFRYFQVPGMLHCRGGSGLTTFDPLTALIDWVENGKAPEQLVASNPKDRPGQSRPLCPYPLYARYNGTGDPQKAESFACVK